MRVLLIAGARPNFMKIAPIYWEMVKNPETFTPFLVHTGQHYDPNMSSEFFHDLNLPKPHYTFNVGSGSHAVQTAAVLVKMEELCNETKPDWVVVVGDVNSTMAATIAAVKLNIPVAHVEAGLRSRDRQMPEEINRLLTDSIADLLLTPSTDADENLINEGVAKEKIILVGNVMIDSLVASLEDIKNIPAPVEGKYAIVTMHRPANVDNKKILEKIVATIQRVSKIIPIVFPMHPRTRAALSRFGILMNSNHKIKLFEPQGYKTFMGWLSNASMAITDSGGIQEETTFLKIPCLTLRENTERPVTITHGTNKLVKIDNLEEMVRDTLNTNSIQDRIPQFWDGNTAERIVEAIKSVDRS